MKSDKYKYILPEYLGELCKMCDKTDCLCSLDFTCAYMRENNIILVNTVSQFDDFINNK